MARPAKFNTEQILDAALAAVTRHGPGATIAQVSAVVDAPVGSIYHRFESREDLFVSLWLRSIRRFQIGFVAAAEIVDADDAIVACAVHIPRYCRDHPAEARALTLYRHADLVAAGPPGLAADIAGLNDGVREVSRQLCARRYGAVTEHRLQLVGTAARQCPYGLVRPYVGGAVPEWLDDATAVAARAILALGDG